MPKLSAKAILDIKTRLQMTDDQLEDIAREYGYENPIGLNSAFRASTGSSLRQFRSEFWLASGEYPGRVGEAIRRLETTQDTSKKIAADLEFPSAPAFARLIFDLTGMAPKNYRKSVRSGERESVLVDSTFNQAAQPSERVVQAPLTSREEMLAQLKENASRNSDVPRTRTGASGYTGGNNDSDLTNAARQHVSTRFGL